MFNKFRPWLFAVRLLLGVAVVGIFAGAILPMPPGTGSDKLQHFVAFYGLTGLALIAFPRTHPIALALALSIFGASIELVQGLSIIGRDRDVADWFVDSVAIAAASLPVLAAWWRRGFEAPSQPMGTIDSRD